MNDIHIVNSLRETAADTVVMVDVIRGFTTAAAALNAGAAHVLCVSTAADALMLARAHPGALLAGEEAGLPPAGFELGNSPRDMGATCQPGTVVVLLTQNGTRELVRARPAPTLIAPPPSSTSRPPPRGSGGIPNQGRSKSYAQIGAEKTGRARNISQRCSRAKARTS